jgi:hypothetical protein
MEEMPDFLGGYQENWQGDTLPLVRKIQPRMNTDETRIKTKTENSALPFIRVSSVFIRG